MLAILLLVASLLFPALAAAESLQMPKELQGTIAYKPGHDPRGGRSAHRGHRAVEDGELSA
jgi:hypothetical protein